MEEDGVQDTCGTTGSAFVFLYFLRRTGDEERKRKKKVEHAPLTTSLTEEGSAKTSMIYSGGRR